MPRDHARVLVKIWSDEDFLDLTARSQWLYLALLTSPSLSYAGVADWRPARLARKAAKITADQVMASGYELAQARFVVVDDDTEEVLLRSFVRHDGLMGQPNVAAAMVKAHADIASRVIRGVVVHELKRLHDEDPGLRGWTRKDVLGLLDKPSVTPDEAFDQTLGNTPRNPSGNPSGKGSENPSGKGSNNPTGNPSGKGYPTPSPAPTPSPSSPRGGQVRDEPSPGTAPTSQAPPSKCPKHQHDPDPGPCGPCADARRARDDWDRARKNTPTFTVNTTRCPDHPAHPTWNCPECANEVTTPPADWRNAG